MKQIVIVNQSTDPAVTTDVLLQIAAALSVQNERDFAPAFDGVKGPDGVPIDAKATFSVAANDAGIPADAIPAFIQDSLDAPGDLGYHDDDGKPEIRIGWGAIKQYGGSLMSGSNSLSVTLSHESVEILADLNASGWVTKADGLTQLAYEVGDPCEGDSLPIDVQAVGALPAGQVSVSNFALPAFFILGSTGKLDFMGRLSSPQVADHGGYEINRVIATGAVSDDFAKTVEAGGTPQWRREQIAAKHKRPGSRHHRRSGDHMGASAPTLLIEGAACPLVHSFSDSRALVTMEGLYVLVDKAPDGTWDLSGQPASPDEMLILGPLVAAAKDTLTVTKDPS